MSYGRMRETESGCGRSRKLLSQAEAADAEEDTRYGRGRRGDELPEELQRRRHGSQRIGEARRALEARAREQAESAGKKPEEGRSPHRKTQYNFTDPGVAHHERAGGVRAGLQHADRVEPNFQLIVGQTVTPGANDKPADERHWLRPSGNNPDRNPEEVLADSG